MKSYEEPLFLISVVSKMFDIHPQTLRQYEREGLVVPNRTKGKMRLYSQKDLDRLKNILNLTRELGVNIAGVDVILKLQDQISEHKNKINSLEIKVEELLCGGLECIPQSKSLVVKKSGKLVPKKEAYDIVVIED